MINSRIRLPFYIFFLNPVYNAACSLRSLRSNKKRPYSIIDNLQVNGKTLHQPPSTSNAINKYFCSVPTEHASSFPKADRHFASFIKGKKCNLRFTKVSEVEVFLLLESIDRKKSFGYDKIHPLLLSSAALEIFRPVTYIINLTLKQGIFPDSCQGYPGFQTRLSFLMR